MEESSCSRSCRGVCGTCKPIYKEFKKIVNLKDSGLTIYVHKDEENQKPLATDTKQDKILLHNTTDKDLKRSDYIKELNKYKTQCFRCNTVLQQIHGLLDEVKEIRENEVRVVCQYCKAPNFTGQCRRCNYLVNKFMATKVKEYDQRIQRFGEWLSKVKHILHAILEESNRARGKSTVQQDLASGDELEKLLLELKTPLKITSRQPRIRQLLETQSVSSAASIAESKEILELLLGRFKTVTQPDFEPVEVKSGSSSISLPPIKTVFKVLPKKSVDSAFTLLPPSSEMLSYQRPFLKSTVPLKKQIQFVKRDRSIRTIDYTRSRYLKREKVQTSGKIARSQAEHDAEPSKEEKDKEDAKRADELARGKDNNKISEGLQAREPLREKSSSDISMKKAEFKRYSVDVVQKTKSSTQIEGFEIPIEGKGSKTYVKKKPLFSIGIVNKNEETLPPTTSEDDQMRTSSRESEIGKKGTYKKGSKSERQMGADGKKKFKIAKDVKDGDYAEDKGKLKGKKKRTRSDGSESDELDISDKEFHKKSTSKGLQKKTGASTTKKSKDKKDRARSDGTKSDESEISDKENRMKSPAKRAQSKPRSSTRTPLQLLKQREMEKKKNEKTEKIKVKETKMPFIAKFPALKYSKRPKDFIDWGTLGEPIAKCESDVESFEMIKGTKVLKYDHYYKKKGQSDDVVQPLLFNAQPVCRTPPDVKKSLPTVSDQPTDAKKVVMDLLDSSEQSRKLEGVLKYALSNRHFIENGYTLLPTLKLMRKEFVYKMIPANPENDWFQRHRQRRLFYETGEKLAEVDEDGHGRWYYKNGIVALNYYKAKEVNAGHRYVIYSSGLSDGSDQDQEQELQPITVLASFDHIGNGVVYDQKGKVRIKYNQTEGIVMDKKIGPIARWKWHDLNDPPDIKPVFVDNYLEHPGACMEEVLKKTSDINENNLQTQNSRIMLNIELENFFKYKAHKMLQEYKPFQIRMKALRINKEFSLKVLDQANIYLLFRSGHVSFKLNLGMVLISNEIIDSDTIEATQMLTPYDRVLPRSESVAEIKRLLEVTRERNRPQNDKFAFKSSPDDIDDEIKSKKHEITERISRLLSRESTTPQKKLRSAKNDDVMPSRYHMRC